MTNEPKTSNQSKTAPAMKAVYACVAIVAACAAVYTAVGLGRRSMELRSNPQRLCPPGQPCVLDTAGMRKTAPWMIKYRETGRIKTGMKDPRGIAAGGDHSVWVVGDKRLVQFNAQGNQQSVVGLDAAAECVTVADDGSVFLGMGDHVEVYKNGQRVARWGTFGTRTVITCILPTASAIYVADAGGAKILCCDKQGRLTTRPWIGLFDPARNIPGLVVPSAHLDMAIAPDGLLRVNNPGRRKIEAYTIDGDLELSWGKSSTDPEGFPGCCNPTDIAVLPDGKIIAADKGLPCVKVYEPDGTFVGVVAGPEAFPEVGALTDVGGFAGLDLAVDGDRVLVLDPVRGDVIIFMPTEAASDEQE